MLMAPAGPALRRMIARGSGKVTRIRDLVDVFPAIIIRIFRIPGRNLPDQFCVYETDISNYRDGCYHIF
jgi:hypothetical protein